MSHKLYSFTNQDATAFWGLAVRPEHMYTGEEVLSMLKGLANTLNLTVDEVENFKPTFKENIDNA